VADPTSRPSRYGKGKLLILRIRDPMFVPDRASGVFPQNSRRLIP